MMAVLAFSCLNGSVGAAQQSISIRVRNTKPRSGGAENWEKREGVRGVRSSKWILDVL
jgi:hypothetical protein